MNVLVYVTGLIYSGYSWQQIELWNSCKQHLDNVNQPFLPRFNKVTKDNVRTHIRKNTCCILHFYELITCKANNEILYFEIYNLSRIIAFNEHTYTEHLNNVLRKFRFVKNELQFWINSSFIFLSCVYQVNREDRL